MNSEETPTTYTVGSAATASVAITGNDPIPTVSVSNTTLSVGEGDGTIRIPITLSNPTIETVRFDWSTATGTASASDFVGQSDQFVEITSGTSAMIQVTITDDNRQESNENFTITFSDAENAVFPNSVGNYIITLTINDNEGNTQISFADSTPKINESAGTLTIRANLNNIPNRAVTVNYVTSDGSAISSGANADFVALPEQTLRFPSGQNYAEFTVTINQDDINEGNENFTVTLRSPVNATFANTVPSISAPVTIVDDELPVLAFKTTEFNPPEQAADFNAVVELIGNISQAVTFDVAVSGGTATKFADYNNPTKTRFEIPLGSTEVAIPIPILADTNNEGNETFNLTISNLVGAEFASGTSLTQTITIVDDESSNSGVFTNDTASVAEDVSSGMIDLEISLTGATANPVTVTYMTSNGIGVRGATAGLDYTAPTAGSRTAEYFCIPVNGNNSNPNFK